MPAIEKNEKAYEWNMLIWRDSLLNGCQSSNVWRQNMSCLAPYKNMFFCLVSTLDATDGNKIIMAMRTMLVYNR